ncbi:MAG: radical SAM family heme chaperone HemW [Bacteroidales bacterium]|nr:radical SAM family heme chaperone HemW [Bacteroidales bacterium]
MMIYVHIPFCRQKCIYCAFYSVPCRNPQLVEEYVDALCAEIALRKNDLPDEKAETLYFGGGTPSLLSPEMIGRICRVLAENFDMSQLQEFTFEANPEQLTKQYLSELKALGVNRLSIGVQSFSDNDLRFLNRRHTARQAIEAVKTAQDCGFDNISVDLIYGIPLAGQEVWEKNLATVESLDIQHLSCYSLTLEPGTAYAKMVEKCLATPCDEDDVLRQYNALTQWAVGSGFEQYEISNFAKNGRRSRHNSGYWNRMHYLGFGASAHSYNGSRRRWNISAVADYVKNVREGLQYFETETLTPSDCLNEYLMTALRTCDGLKTSVLAKDFPDFLPHLQPKLQRLVSQELLRSTPDGYAPTPQGLLMADGMAAELFVVGR